MKSTTNVYWGTFQHQDWRFYLATTDKGLCYIGSPNQPFTELETWVAKKITKPVLYEASDKLDAGINALRQYLNGEKSEFQLSLDIIGTDFQKSVWQASQEIPYGETKTYQQLAVKIENPKAVRAVGTAIGANPLLMIIPCHRIVAKNGSLSGFRAGLDMKEFLLNLESENA